MAGHTVEHPSSPPRGDLKEGFDFKAQAERMHRRAQKAEGELFHALALVERLRGAVRSQAERADTHRNMRDKQRKRANRWQAEVERLREASDPLARIIAMGKRFRLSGGLLGVKTGTDAASGMPK